MAVKYLAEQAISWIIDFFRAWHVDGFRVFFRAIINLLFNLDRIFAFRASIKNLFEPMYQDGGVMGYTMRFFFKLIRIATAFVLYIVIGIMFATSYVLWALIPFFLAIKIFNPNAFSVF